jgi:hypothetical protein
MRGSQEYDEMKPPASLLEAITHGTGNSKWPSLCRACRGRGSACRQYIIYLVALREFHIVLQTTKL